ncbi:hypothetical protein C0992_006644 [Termitomyces sp. T32_za158]|nr:hypothetical protein C0992_006644 [Termitomyces sp. T32_za158]
MLLQTFSFALLVTAAVFYARRKRIPLPPGPPSIPVIGHIHLIPPAGQDMFFYELGKQYGDDKNYRIQRKMFEQYFNKAKCREYRDIQLREARVLAQHLLAKPETNFNPLLLR